MSDRDGVARLDATVEGRVQGVGFRWFVVRTATRLGVMGWVANEPDGSVRCVAEGPADALDELERSLEAGPAGAAVDRVKVVRMPATGGFSDFGVRARGHRGD